MTAPPTEHDRVFARWLEWLEEARSQVTVMKHHQQLWRTMVEVLQRRAPDESAAFKIHYTRLYVEAQVMGIRRVADRHPDAMSLRRMLEDIVKQPHVLTRARYIASTSNDAEWVAADRDRRFSGLELDGTDHIDPRHAQADLDLLQTATDRVCRYVDKQVAHIDRQKDGELTNVDPLTFGLLHETIDTVGTVVQRWHNILRDTHVMLKPVIQNDWKGPFRRPLFAPPGEWGDPRWDDREFDYTEKHEW
jgi:hypothetical protein